MDPAITAGIIGAVATCVASYVATRMNKQRKDAENHTEQLEAALNESPPSSDISPYTMGTMVKTITLDESGGGEQIQEWRELKLNQSFENLDFPVSFAVHGQGAEIIYVKGQQLSGSSTHVNLRTSESINEQEHRRSLKGVFTLLDSCGKDSRFIGFYWKIGFKKGYLTSREAVIESYSNTDWKTEYTSSAVTLPTDNLEMEVNFPEAYKQEDLKLSRVVFVRETHTVNRLETERVKKFFRVVDQKAELIVSQPLVGMRYAITWMPPSGSGKS